MGSDRSAAVQADSARPVVLLVEDEDPLRLAIAQALRDSGYAVIEASNADEALAVLRVACDVRAVFADVRVPGRMDGLALARQIRTEHPGLKVIVADFSAFDLVAPLKPYSAGRVVQLIARLIGPGTGL